MKTYDVEWTQFAFDKALNYTLQLVQVFNADDAQRFFDSLMNEAEKLSFLADVYYSKKYIVVKKHYKLSYFIKDTTVYIYDFKDQKRELS